MPGLTWKPLYSFQVFAGSFVLSKWQNEITTLACFILFATGPFGPVSTLPMIYFGWGPARCILLTLITLEFIHCMVDTIRQGLCVQNTSFVLCHVNTSNLASVSVEILNLRISLQTTVNTEIEPTMHSGQRSRRFGLSYIVGVASKLRRAMKSNVTL